MTPIRALLVAAAATLSAAHFAPRDLAAQSAQRLSVQASGLYVGTFGTAYDGIKAGPGVEAQIRFTPSAWSFGAGFQYSQHDLSLAELGNEKVKLMGVFFEPRLVIDVGSSSLAPYVSARAAVLRQSADVLVQQTSVYLKATGAQINGGGGVLVRMSPAVNRDFGATYGLIHFGDVKADIPGQGSVKVDGTSGNGQNLVVRVGVAIGLR